MNIGIDFDNTIVCYDKVFSELAAQNECFLDHGQTAKSALRDFLRSQTHGEKRWIQTQGEAYGPRILDATPYPAFLDFVRIASRSGHRLCIVSHKSEFSLLGKPVNLREWARKWIYEYLSDPLQTMGDQWLGIYFEPTLEQKLQRISDLKCDVFVDDLPDVLLHRSFPNSTQAVWFNPSKKESAHRLLEANSWDEMESLLLKTESRAHPPVSSINREFRFDCASAVIARETGETVSTWESLRGGNNSQAYAAILESGNRFACKQYPHRQLGDPRNRIAHERSFLNLKTSFDRDLPIPKLIGTDIEASIAIMGWIQGEIPAQEDLDSKATWKQCILFLKDLQSTTGENLPIAAEGACSLQAHLDQTRKRRDHWLGLAHRKKLPGPIAEFLKGRLEDLFQEVSLRLVNSPIFKSAPKREELIISPSDFGLHNCLIDSEKRLHFIDFEYAGWDDPAKTIADFFCQPRYPAPQWMRHDFVATALHSLSDDSKQEVLDRLPLVEQCIAIKWVYMILDCQLHSTPIDALLSTLESRIQWSLNRGVANQSNPDK